MPSTTNGQPTTLDHRFLTDDVTCGLAVLEQLARHLAVPVPLTTARVTALSAATATDLRAGTDVRAKALLAAVQQI
ncbi:NAD/NADP octopine/nopaline dehydrogenase family protein [Kribbella sp. NPDC000426]|uniref:NAD/NADP octopine/nopaline dehydrogenase family protein n=1 Tax=Kribbella sp. NPDC000426 TaxID=3154255 RepID=UPI00332F5324